MRIDNQIIQFFKQSILEKKPEAKLYLFGSRASDDSTGGDIDILIITQTPIHKSIIRSIRVEFFKKFGWQKVDMVNFTENDSSVFKQLILSNAVEL
jgi:uncharacterized protein